MYRILVVDDEAFITDSLAFLLENQESASFEVTKAYSAGEALEYLNCSFFQIVISDIEMPGASGLDLLREIHEKWPLCQVVFLSGHDDFGYAHQAMRYNAVRYVLKNEGDDILLEAVEECVRRIEKERGRAGYLLEQRIESRNQGEMGEAVLRRLISSKENIEDVSFEGLGLCLDSKQGVMLMGVCSKEEMSVQQHESVKNLVQAKIGYAVRFETVLLNNTLAIWLMQPAGGSNRMHTLAALRGFAEEIKKACFTFLNIHISFVLEDEEISWEMVRSKVDIIQDIAQNRLDDYKGVAMAGFRLFEDTKYTAQEFAFVDNILTYIKEHIGENLSLTTLSELVYLNQSYLSRRFKEMTGQNITETILSIRMEEACRRLRHSSLRIKNIALEVGYESAAHFSRIFKREVGMTPQEYRDQFYLPE